MTNYDSKGSMPLKIAEKVAGKCELLGQYENRDYISRGHEQYDSKIDRQESRMVKAQEQQRGLHQIQRRHYKKLRLLGEGANGRVYYGKDLISKAKVALKEVKLLNEAFLWKVEMLRRCEHENIIKLIEVVPSSSLKESCRPCLPKLGKPPPKKDNTQDFPIMVFEYAPKNLDAEKRLLNRKIQAIMEQFLRAVAYCHSIGVLHCDIKPDNILLDANYNVKLADFGLARTGCFWRPHCLYNINFRAPELVFGCQHYGFAADMWAAGCVFAELLLRQQLFKAETEVHLLAEICEMVGVPSEYCWPGVSLLPDYRVRMSCLTIVGNSLGAAHHIKQRLGNRRICWHALDLIEKMLKLNPAERITAAGALEHAYFQTPKS